MQLCDCIIVIGTTKILPRRLISMQKAVQYCILCRFTVVSPLASSPFRFAPKVEVVSPLIYLISLTLNAVVMVSDYNFHGSKNLGYSIGKLGKKLK